MKMPEKTPNRYDKIVAICLKRGIFYPSSEIYETPAGFYDYGSVGTKIKHSFQNWWRTYFLKNLYEPFFEIDCCLAMPEQVFQASGHLGHFKDPITECKKCGLVEKADHLLESHLHESFEGLSPEELDKLIKKHGIKCHACGGELKDAGAVDLMFGFNVGPYAQDSKSFLRPETAQGVYVSFKREYAANREKFPLGLAIIGKAFRNEISPRQNLFRMREFTQAELQVFFDPSKADEHGRFKEIENYELNVVFAEHRADGAKKVTCKELRKHFPAFYLYYAARVQQFYESLGIGPDKFRFFEKTKEERAHYNKLQLDGEVFFPSFGEFREVMGMHYRGEHDLGGHSQVSKKDLSVLKDGKRFIPHVIELSFGVDRNILALLDAGYRDEKERAFFVLPKHIAPYVAGVYPLVSKDGLDKKAETIYKMLNQLTSLEVFYDDSGSIGRRYARADEIGIPFGITIDYDTMKDDTVTVREIESTKQHRVRIPELGCYLWTHSGQ